MSQTQKMAKLCQQLEKWKSHNEVHAKPADAMLYEFLSDLLKLAEENEQPEISEDASVVSSPASTSAESDEDGEGGGDTPPAPDVP